MRTRLLLAGLFGIGLVPVIRPSFVYRLPLLRHWLVSQQKPSVGFASTAPFYIVERSGCVVLTIGPSADSECGDLRITHPLPSVRTFNRLKTPTLIYNSEFAHPYAVLPMQVTLSATTDRPDSVEVRVYEYNVTNWSMTLKQTGRWAGSEWPAGQNSTRQVSLAVDRGSDTTCYCIFYLEAVNKYPGVDMTQGYGNAGLFILNRKSSAFGAGWWLAGLEKLMHKGPSNQKVWFDGDGSARFFMFLSAVGTDSTWYTATYDKVDTLYRTGSGGTLKWTKTNSEGVRTQFDSYGRHVKTIDRFGRETVFGYSGNTDTLKTITLPVTGQQYSFTYSGGRLSSVTSPSVNGTARTATISTSNGRITSIRNPGDSAVTFTYPSGADSNMMATRVTRRGTVDSFYYDAARRIRKSVLKMGSSPSDIAWVLTHAHVRGLPASGSLSSVDTSMVYTHVDGPRSDKPDTTVIRHIQFGAPTRLVNALNDPPTRFLYGCLGEFQQYACNWVPLRGYYPNDRVMMAEYDWERGNLLRIIDSATAVANQMDTTRYEWDSKFNQLVRIIPPEHDSTVFFVSATNGRRDSLQDSRGSSSRVKFGYDGTYVEQVTTMTLPAVGGSTATYSYAYDFRRNHSSTTTPRGFITAYTRDSIGRVTKISSPIDTNSATKQVEQRFKYDLLDRVTHDSTITVNVTPAAKVMVQNFYNSESQLDSVKRWVSPDSANIGTIKTIWKYDAAGRRTIAIAPDSKSDTTVYDPAGNIIAMMTRRFSPGSNGHVDTLKMEYNELNQLTKRVLPAITLDTTSVIATSSNYDFALEEGVDTVHFHYGLDGQVDTVTNKNAQVVRAYLKNGLLISEILKIQKTDRSGYGTHTYTTQMAYDRSGRRISLTAPGILGGATAAFVQTAWGPVDSMSDFQGNAFKFSYNVRGELEGINMGGAALRRAMRYDQDGRLVRDSVLNSGGTGFPRFTSSTLRGQSLARNARAQLLKSNDPSSFFQNATTMTYTGLGQLDSIRVREKGFNAFGDTVTYATGDRYSYDPLGNMVRMETRDSFQSGGNMAMTQLKVASDTFEAGTGRLLRAPRTAIGINPQLSLYAYDREGNNHFESTLYQCAGGGVNVCGRERVSLFGADGLLRWTVTRVRETADEVYDRDIFEEYRYDGLGRRVMVRNTRQCYIGTQDLVCTTPFVRRTIWDGVQELGEIQAPVTVIPSPSEEEADSGWSPISTHINHKPDPNPFYGRVVYTPGLAVDQPLSVTRFAYRDWPRVDYDSARTWATFTLIPQWNAYGVPAFGSMGDGAAFKQFQSGGSSCPPVGDTVSTRCALVQWPAAHSAYDQRRGVLDTRSWNGSLLEAKRDGSGYEYKRNRYYDPTTGRFTQEDPIGLAGGLSLYGFAESDPVNSGDPFGLCPPDDNNTDDCQMNAKGANRTSYCPTGSVGAPPNCRSLATGITVNGSCPNVSAQEWDLGQQAIALTRLTEEGFLMTSGGEIQRANGPSWIKTERSIGPVGRWPSNASTFVHSHPSGGGISPGDVGVAEATGIRVVSAGVRTNRFGSTQRGAIPVTCNMPRRPR